MFLLSRKKILTGVDEQKTEYLYLAILQFAKQFDRHLTYKLSLVINVRSYKNATDSQLNNTSHLNPWATSLKV